LAFSIRRYSERSSYFLAGQLIGVRVKTGTSSDVRYFAYADHLGNVAAWTNGGSYFTDSLARYEPFGGYRTKPTSATNPGISDRGFTGHRHNNIGANHLNLTH